MCFSRPNHFFYISLFILCFCIACTSAQKNENKIVETSPQFELPEKNKSFINNIDFNNPEIINNNTLESSLNQYFDKNIPPVATYILPSMDMMMAKTRNNQKLKDYLFNYFHEKYKIPIYVSDDNILIHLSEKYATPDIILGFGKNAYRELKNHVEKLKPVSIGKIVSNYEGDIIGGGKYSSSKQKADYTVLFFWSPTCDECTKAVPALVEFANTHKEEKIEIITVCNAVGESAHECEPAVAAKGLTGFTNLCDFDGTNTILDKFYVQSTPMVFVLDNKNKILIKRIGTSVLNQVFIDIKNNALRF